MHYLLKQLLHTLPPCPHPKPFHSNKPLGETTEVNLRIYPENIKEKVPCFIKRKSENKFSHLCLCDCVRKSDYLHSPESQTGRETERRQQRL